MKQFKKDFEKVLALCKEAFLKARTLIPYSTNLCDEGVKNSHRTLLLFAMRSQDPTLSSYKKLICRLNLFVGEEKKPKYFLRRTLEGVFEGKKNPSMSYLYKKFKKAEDQEKLRHKDGTWVTKNHRVENKVKWAIQFGVGNCGELSYLAYALLLELKNIPIKKIKIRLERMHCETGDHAFVVVNRKKNSQIDDLSTWGSKALIIDPWAEEINYAKTGKSAVDFGGSSNCYNYIKTHKPCVDSSSSIGAGLSKRFINHAKAKQRPNSFSLWSPKYTGVKDIDSKKEIRIIPLDLQEDAQGSKRKKEDIQPKESSLSSPQKRTCYSS